MKKTFLSIVLILFVILCVGCGKKELTKEEKTEQQIKKIIRPVEIDGLRIDISSMVYENNETTLTASITNLTQNIIEYDSIKVVYTDNENNIYEIEILLPSEIQPDQTIYTDVKTPDDLTKATRVNYSIYNK